MTERNVVRQYLQRAGGTAAKASLAATLALSMTPALALADETAGENEKEATALTATNNDAAASQASADEQTSGSVAQYSTEGAENVGVQLHANGTYDLAKVKDGTYRGTAYADANDPLNTKDYWGIDGYDVSVSVTVASGKISAVEVGSYDALDDENWDYMNKADKGYTNNRTGTTYTGIPTQIKAAGSTQGIDAVSTATISSNAIVAAVDNALQAAYDAQNPVVSAPEAGTYVLMNIPYSMFYAAETPNNSVAVDVFTSATMAKARNASLAAGSYHPDETCASVNGITFPVLVTESAAENFNWSTCTQLTDSASTTITVSGKGSTTTTTYEGKDALFEAADYAFYQLGSNDAPATYKELTVNDDGTWQFSELKGNTTVTQVSDDDATFETTSTWGDYELDLSDAVAAEGAALNGATIYGVVVNTTDGTGYGLRHIENIWRTTELAWGTGSGDSFKNAAKGCTLSWEHYASMMGKTIKSVTYYTSNGLVEITVGGNNGFYVPIKTNDATVQAEDTSAEDGVATATVTLPDGFEPQYLINGEEVTPLASSARSTSTVSFDVSNLELGSHTLEVVDKSNNYATISSDFQVTTSKVVAQFSSEKAQLVAAEGATADELANYLGNISVVTVNGTQYKASGHGSKKVFNDDGTLNSAVISEDGTYEMEIQANGYSENLTFTYVLGSGSDANDPENPGDDNDGQGDDNGGQGGNQGGSGSPTTPSNPNTGNGQDGSGSQSGPNNQDGSSTEDGKQSGEEVKQLPSTGDTAPFALAAAAATVAGGIAAAAALVRRRLLG